MLSNIVISIKKLEYTIGLILFSLMACSQTEMQKFERLDFEKLKNDVDTIKMEIDSTFFYINATYHLLKEEVELFGWKKMIRMNSDIFLSILIWGILYLLWLRGRRLQ